jgi:transcriptional regulator with XRE-family HTH domain
MDRRDRSFLGRTVRARRAQLDISQADVAERMGEHALDQNMISKIEHGERQALPLDKLEALSHALELPPAALKEAQERIEAVKVEQMARAYAVGPNPLKELSTVAPVLSKQNQATLVRMARVLLYGEQMARGHDHAMGGGDARRAGGRVAHSESSCNDLDSPPTAEDRPRRNAPNRMSQASSRFGSPWSGAHAC